MKGALFGGQRGQTTHYVAQQCQTRITQIYSWLFADPLNQNIWQCVGLTSAGSDVTHVVSFSQLTAIFEVCTRVDRQYFLFYRFFIKMMSSAGSYTAICVREPTPFFLTTYRKTHRTLISRGTINLLSIYLFPDINIVPETFANRATN